MTDVKLDMEHFGQHVDNRETYSILVDGDLGSNDARKVSGGFHQQVDIDTGAVGTSQLGEGEQKLQG